MAADTLAVANVEIVEGDVRSSYPIKQRITLGDAAVSEQHPILIRVPEPLSRYWNDVVDATCDPGFPDITAPTQRTCVPQSKTLTLVHGLGSAAALDLAGQPAFVVTVQDTVTGQTATGTVRIVSQADLVMHKLVPQTLEADGKLFVQVEIMPRNLGPSTARSVTVRATFHGTFAFYQIPSSCTVAANVVTCALGNVRIADFRFVDLFLAQAEGSYTVTAEVMSTSIDAVPSNNTSQSGPFDNVRGPNYVPPPNNPPPANPGPNTGGRAEDPSPQTSTAAPAPAVVSAQPSADAAAATDAPAAPRAAAEVRHDENGNAWPAVLAGVALALTLAVTFAYFLIRRHRPVAPDPALSNPSP
ncbi:DUF11 domain-containing protein [Rhizocola hellebori]|uniref:DUF11 domain-containing protein n=1 Tax=Rhizocola hellebori TaxID=1392758 RepID=UPI0019415C1F|nr:DUF11 domain-containing protein [Rhizocola hellebori]